MNHSQPPQHNETERLSLVKDSTTDVSSPPPPSSNYGSATSLYSMANSEGYNDSMEYETSIDLDDENSQLNLTPTESLPTFTVISILSTAFSYGCIFSTLFLITLPIECERIHQQHETLPKSVALGIFVAIAGVTQLISPLVGRLSDIYIPPKGYLLGQRLPYLVLGGICTVVGLLGQMAASLYGFWVRYSFFFFVHMLGLNIQYAMMLALIPDQVAPKQTGVANGILALELVVGSLFAFGLFYSVLYQYIQSMYGLYTCIVVVSTILTGTHAHDRDVTLAKQRRVQRRLSLKRQSLKQQQEEELQEAKSPSTWHKAAKKAVKKAKHVLVMAPTMILKSLLVDPFGRLNWKEFWSSYTIDVRQYHDFFVVTVSRLFYYSGMSIQTFFLYYVHDVLHVTGQDAEGVVAWLAILGQCSAAFTCYPVGVLSDKYLHGSRRPLVYLACAILFSASLSLVFIHSLHQMTLVVLILGSANGIYLTMDTSLAVDTLPSGVEDSAQLLGVWGVAAFLGSALGPMVGGPLLYIFGRDTTSSAEDDGGSLTPSSEIIGAHEDEEIAESYDWLGYAVVLSLGSCYFLTSALILCFIRGDVKKNSPHDDDGKLATITV